jgi:hypothetical protein
MTLTAKATDVLAQDVIRRVSEVIRDANPKVAEINRLLFLVTVFENQAHDLRRSAGRRVTSLKAKP